MRKLIILSFLGVLSLLSIAQDKVHCVYESSGIYRVAVVNPLTGGITDIGQVLLKQIKVGFLNFQLIQRILIRSKSVT